MGIVKSIRIQNFKSLEDVTIDLSQLTFLFGANSSGKSSFLKALMFLAKNLYKYGRNSLNFKVTKEIDLVDFEQIAFGFDTSKNVKFKLKLKGTYEFPTKNMFFTNEAYICNIPLSDFINSNTTELPKEISTKVHNFSLDYEIEYSKNGFSSLKIFNRTKPKRYFEARSHANYVTKLTFAGFGKSDVNELFENYWSGENPLYNLQNLNHVYSNRFNSFFEINTDKWDVFSKEWESLPEKSRIELFYEWLRFAHLVDRVIPDSLSDWLSFQYLGLTRKIPKRTYQLKRGKPSKNDYYGIIKEIQGRRSQDVFKSEAEKRKLNIEEYVKALASNKEFQDLLSKESFDESGFVTFVEVDKKNIQRDLVIYSTYQLHNFKFQILFFTEVTEAGISLKLMDWNGHAIDFANASSGFIQLFPVILSCGIIREKESMLSMSHEDRLIMNNTLIIEQPELHLHPKLQSKLSELFAVTVESSNRDLFIETHSEHLIRKLQVLIAKGELAREKVGVWYFKKVNGVTKVEKMDIDENGLFKNDWPDGFFDDSIDLTMELFEALRKRKN